MMSSFNGIVRFVALLIVTSGALIVSGCGKPNITEEKVTPGAPPQLKQMLTNVAETGELGSGAMTIKEELEKLKATDAAKADGLLKDLEDLQKTTDQGQVKSKAKAMADKL